MEKFAWHLPHAATLHVAARTFRRIVCMTFSVTSGTWGRIPSTVFPKANDATAILVYVLTILYLSPTLFLPLFPRKTFLLCRRKWNWTKSAAALTRRREIICYPANSSVVIAAALCKVIPDARVAICTTTIHARRKTECLRTDARRRWFAQKLLSIG